MLSKNLIKSIRKLHQKKYRLQELKFIAEGTKIVDEIIRSGYAVEHIFATQAWIDVYKKTGLPTEYIEPAEVYELQQISCLQTVPEVVSICSIPSTPQVSSGSGLSVYLDSVRDPGNLGTILRLADWFNIDAVYASADTVEWTNPKCIQASMGSFLRIIPQVVAVEDLARLKETASFFAADLQGENLFNAEFVPQGILIVSSESHGLSSYLEPLINMRLTIPKFRNAHSAAESLNVASALAIFLSEFNRRKL
ncbi:MAG: RNA methyltransferase [Bacteroidia bacterium]|jgi:TrmH family RNA methyltransferase